MGAYTYNTDEKILREVKLVNGIEVEQEVKQDVISIPSEQLTFKVTDIYSAEASELVKRSIEHIKDK